MLLHFLPDINMHLYLLIAAAASFFLTLLGILVFTQFLPKDQGRPDAVNGQLSKGKARGAGIIMIIALIVTSVFGIPLNLEYAIYLLAIFLEMMSGYLDDASKIPWGELKKGLIDFAVAIGVSVTAYYFHGGMVLLPILGISFTIPTPVYILLGVILIWASINVTNCADGVDGLCTSLSVITLFSLFIVLMITAFSPNNAVLLNVMTICMLLAYLWFNCSPSTLLMGDAGSRALGLIIAILSMCSGMPFLFIPFAIMLIIDGGLGLLKLTVLRATKSKTFMKNIRTPIHDHMRKNKHWGDTQVVIRFTLIQVCVSVIFVLLTLSHSDWIMQTLTITAD